MDRPRVLAPAADQPLERGPGLLRAARPHEPGTKERIVSAAKLVVLPAVRAKRRRLDATVIGITGSAGKTTTKNLLAAVLETVGPVVSTPGTRNRGRHLATTIAAARRRHRFVVAEVAATKARDSLDDLLWALEPEVAVVTAIGRDHFGNADEAAAEKAKIARRLPASGLAVLNADDPCVSAMATETAARTVLFGLSADADVRAEHPRSRWPGRLTFALVAHGERRLVETRLVGTVWTHAVLAALATGVSLGADLDEAVSAVREVEPRRHHLSVLETASGAVIVQDEWKGAAWTVGPALQVLDRADAGRRVAVIGSLSADGRRPQRLYLDVAHEAREHADLVVVVGPSAHRALRARSDEADDSIRVFETVGAAGGFLREELGPGDLVLVKGAHIQHLERAVLAQTIEVACRRVECRKLIFCENCRLLRA